MITKISLVLSLAIPMMACGGAQEDAAEDNNGEAAAAAEVPGEETVFDPMLDAIDQARAVQETVDGHREKMEAALEEAENGDGDD